MRDWFGYAAGCLDLDLLGLVSGSEPEVSASLDASEGLPPSSDDSPSKSSSSIG